jgi:hypothetical protein
MGWESLILPRLTGKLLFLDKFCSGYITFKEKRATQLQHYAG